MKPDRARVRVATLTRAHFVVLAATLAALATASAIATNWPRRLYDLKCAHVDLPAHETSFGFTLGVVEASGLPGDARVVQAITALDPRGRLARAGARVGDVPAMYHGLSDFCADLRAATVGETVQLHLYNLNDAKAGREPRRAITLRKE